MNIIFKSDNQDEFWKLWEEYLKFNIGSFHYDRNFLEYLTLYSKNQLIDKSFVLTESKKVVGICFLPIEKLHFGKSVSIGDDFVFAPLSNNLKFEKKMFQIIDEKCQEYGVKKIQFAVDTLISILTKPFNHLLKYGYIQSSMIDSLIDLKMSEKKLWSNMRKGHKYDINLFKKSKDYTLEIYDYNNPIYEINELYRKMHIKCAGRETRKKETFDKQFEMLKNDKATIFAARYKSDYVAFNYFMHSHDTVEYASAAADPDCLDDTPKYHRLLWESILYYKNRGFKYMRLTEPCALNLVDGYNDISTTKQIQIGHYKRGFGGELMFLNKGTKYFDKSLLFKDIELFKNQVINIFNNKNKT